MKKYIIAFFIIAFSTLGVNYVMNTTEDSQGQLSMDNVEALACTILSETGPNGGRIWCECIRRDLVCHENAALNEIIYGYAQEH